MEFASLKARSDTIFGDRTCEHGSYEGLTYASSIPGSPNVSTALISILSRSPEEESSPSFVCNVDGGSWIEKKV